MVEDRPSRYSPQWNRLVLHGTRHAELVSAARSRRADLLLLFPGNDAGARWNVLGKLLFFRLIPARRFNQAGGIALSSSSKPIRPEPMTGSKECGLTAPLRGRC